MDASGSSLVQINNYASYILFNSVITTRPQCKKSENERMTGGGRDMRGLCLCPSLNNAAANAAGS